METQNITPNELGEDKTVSAPTKSKYGIFGLILGIPGLGISVSTLFIIYIIMVAGGGLDIMLTPAQGRAIMIVLYCGLILGIVGGAFGVMGITRGENKLVSVVSILLGVIMLCACSAITFLIFTFNLMV